jgi:hypothetical protein
VPAPSLARWVFPQGQSVVIPLAQGLVWVSVASQ